MLKTDRLTDLTRRGFLKTMAAVGAAGAFAGYGGAETDIRESLIEAIDPPDLETDDYYYVTGGHNCHVRCVSKVWVKDGRIVRITSVGEDARPGINYDPDSYGNPQQRACGKCRSYKYRLSHPGRLRYPLKQTKLRGDLSGFIRISWDQALEEIAKKHWAILKKYGPEAVYSILASGAEGGGLQAGGYAGLWSSVAYLGESPLVLRYLGGTPQFAGDYSYHQGYNWDNAYVGYPGTSAAPPSGPGAQPFGKTPQGKPPQSKSPEASIAPPPGSAPPFGKAPQGKTPGAFAFPMAAGIVRPNLDQLAGGTIKNLVSFGDNSLTTKHNRKQAQVAAYAMARKNGTRVTYIAPELVDTGVNIADEFIPTKPYTTAALMTGMLHEMIINTFNADGGIRSGIAGSDRNSAPWLDIEYLDTAVYGFFDSPEYWVAADAEQSGVPLGTIVTTEPESLTGWRKVNAVPAGTSWSAYIMGNDDRLTKARYDAVRNHVARRFAAGGQTFRNIDICNQPIARGADNTAYIRKREYRVPKTAEWASRITGIPAQRIRDLAWMYCNPAQHPIFHTYGYGMEKQLDGIMSRFTLIAFMTVTKTFGMVGHGIEDGMQGAWGFAAQGGAPPPGRADMPNQTLTRTNNAPATDAGANIGAPIISTTQWHNAIRMAFMDVMLDPTKGKGAYTAKHIPDYQPAVDFKSHADGKNLSAWKDYIGRVYQDDGGAKGLVKLQRGEGVGTNPCSGVVQVEPDTNMPLYATEGGKPVYSGYRWIMNSGGNIMMNQHMNPNDTREMLESIPSCGQTGNPDDPDDLCVISFDNFLSPSPRWSDYVLPAKTNREHLNRASAGGQNILMPEIVEAPGESRDTFDFTVAFLRAYEKIRPELAGVADQYTGHDNAPDGNTPLTGDRYMDKFKRAYDRAAAAGAAPGFAEGGRYRGKTFEEALKVQYELPLPVEMNPTVASRDFTGVRLTVENYLAGLRDGTIAPDTPLWLNISTATTHQGGSGFMAANMRHATGSAATAPVPSTASGRYHVYSEVIRWTYAKRYEGWHKHLLDRGLPIGQRPDDIEGDPLIPLIPMYFNYEDSFMEAYGGPERMKELPENNRFLVTTPHSIHRAHSSMAESPLLRELTARVRGGAEFSGNDWGTYALSVMDSDGRMPRINSSINVSGNGTDFRRASWTEVLMNAKDGERLGIKDGDIIEMRNPIGAVRVSVKLTRRAARGYIALHQGSWYDPDPVDGVDDGGCANTIMCTRGSRLDHGNGQHSAMVTVKKAF